MGKGAWVSLVVVATTNGNGHAPLSGPSCWTVAPSGPLFMVAPPPSSPLIPAPTPVQTLMHTWHVAIALGLGATNVWKVSGNSGSCNIIDKQAISQLSFLPSDPVHASHQNLPISRQISVSPKSNAVSRHKADKLPRHSTLSPPLSLSLSFSRAVQVEAYCLANPHTLWQCLLWRQQILNRLRNYKRRMRHFFRPL